MLQAPDFRAGAVILVPEMFDQLSVIIPGTDCKTKGIGIDTEAACLEWPIPWPGDGK